ncbi:hypothetical protein MMC25_000782 [Agyrium rufum]|nr:hypothetical protein [Agyrium rufum]
MNLFGLRPSKPMYHEVEKGELSEEQVTFLPESESSFHERRTHTQNTRSLKLLTALNLLFLAISLFTNYSNYTSKTAISSGTAIRESSYYSPILNDLDVELIDVQMNGTLWPAKESSWMRAEPTAEVDVLWDAFEPLDVFPITRADVIGLGKDPETAVKFENDYWGLGDDAYMAGFDNLHKTHCLNELRKMTFEDYGERTPEKKRHGRLWWVHLRHCVDMLMQDQLCHADADIITFQWVDTQNYPWADMSINRKCRNWDQIYQWGKERYVDFSKLRGVTKPKGANQVPYERGYYDWYGFDGSDLFPNGTGYEW